MSVTAPPPRHGDICPASWPWFAAFTALTLLTRLWFLHLEMIDWDESTYIVRGSNLWDAASGHLDVWYFRPPAFTAALWLLNAVCGASLVALRAFGWCCIVIAACFTFLACRRALGSVQAGLGVCVLLAGLSALSLQPTMTEQWVIACLAVVLWLLMERPGPLWSAGLAGLCMSLATLTRMNIAYAVLALGVYYLVGGLRRTSRTHRFAVIAYGIGGALPLLAVAAGYGLSGAMDRFFLFLFGIVLSYAFDQLPLLEVLRLQAGNWTRFVTEAPQIYGLLTLFLTVGAVIAIRQTLRGWRAAGDTAAMTQRLTRLMLLLGGPVLLSIITGGAPYAHYWVQLFPFAAFLVALTLASVPSGLPALAARAAAIVIIAFPTIEYGSGAVHLAFHWSNLAEAHIVQQAADRIAADRKAGDRVLALENHLILWYLHEPPISPVVSHPADIIQLPIMQPLLQAGLVHADEFARILDTRPRYIVRRQGPVYYLDGRPEGTLLETTLAAQYEPWFTDGRRMEVFRRR